ncbi:MAG: two component, sigma54 specific, transcriptional regulator, Fis family [Deltaproteobacteria bacterium]|jgi:two-component system response regulator GlrR|nr:two component, sigma54 specific, transcriptional regulator, Fis family [Deltaproteobacteria bacterium]
MSLGKILIVDDDANLLELIKMRLESADYEVTAAREEDNAVVELKAGNFDLCIVDLMLANRDGITLMEEFRAVNPEVPTIILTAHGSIQNAVEAMRRGAYSYLTKPFEPGDLLLQIERALENRKLNSEIKRLKGLLHEQFDFANIIARSAKMRSVLDVVMRIARLDSTVHIHGESGTGKELIAKAIHLASDRKDKPFIALNCAALPETLLESELFGHEKGAFTGAVKSTRGLFTQAHGGTLFLDEIGDMPLSTQSKLLRVLQERQFYPVGSEIPIEVDVRVIAATNKDLEELVKKGTFRDDLFYRIHVIPIYLPPLRDHKEDIVPLVEHFLKKCSQQMKKDVKGITPEALRKLMLHDWPGNVRELENTIEYSVAMTQKEFVTEEYILQGKISFSDGAQTGVNDKQTASDDALRPLKDARDAFERDYLVQVLSMTDGNVSQAAKLAGKYRADFYDLLKKHDLKADDFKKTKSAASASS